MSSPDDDIQDVRVEGIVPTVPLPTIPVMTHGAAHDLSDNTYIDSAGVRHASAESAQLAELRRAAAVRVQLADLRRAALRSAAASMFPPLQSTPHSEPNEFEAMWRAATAETAPEAPATPEAPAPQGGRVVYHDYLGRQHRTIESVRAVVPPWEARPDLRPIPVTPLNEQFYFNGNVYATRSEMQAAIYALERQLQEQSPPRRSAAVAPPTPPVDDGMSFSTNGPPTAPIDEDDRWYGPDVQRRAREAQEASRFLAERAQRSRENEPITINPNNKGRFTITVGVATLKAMTYRPDGDPWFLSAADLAGVLVNRMLRHDGTQSPIDYFLMQMLSNTWPDAPAPATVAPVAVQPHRYERTIHLDAVPPQPEQEG